jgi:hypothetical protein
VMHTHEVPNPGSKEAIAIGCSCPVLDNNKGSGVPAGEDVYFWVRTDCPIHRKKDEGAECSS